MYGTFNRVTQNSTFNRTGPLIGSLEYFTTLKYQINEQDGISTQGGANHEK